jgi:hypothetical protein
MSREPRLQAPWAATLMGWLTVVLMLDADGSLTLQRVLGGLTWGVLILAMSRVSSIVKAQTLVVVAFATAVEYVFSPTLEVYLYRFHNVPSYVPPGHGLVYLSAYALGHALWVSRHRDLCTAAVVAGLGAFWFLCLVAFLRWGPSLEVYLGAAVVVTWLEIVGTAVGTWEWQPHDPTGLISIGNPPTGAAGGYGWFDLAGLLLAPALLALWRRACEAVGPGVTDLRGEADPDPRPEPVDAGH